MTKALPKDFIPSLEWIDSQHDIMCQELFSLANINSGSFNLAGLQQVEQKLEELFAPLGGTLENLSLPPLRCVNEEGEYQFQQLGKALRIRKRPEAPLRVFLGGHMDTVFAANHPFQETQKLDKNTLRGPGVADLKGGLLVMLKALEAFEMTPWAENVGWEVLINPDEEIGSPGSANLFIEAAKHNHLGLIFEPSISEECLAGARKGSGNFTMIVKGRSAHAGREHHLGRNAIRAVTEFILAIDSLNGLREGVTINPGYVKGGGAANMVPDLAIAKFNIRIATLDDELWVMTEMDKIQKKLAVMEGISFDLQGYFQRKPKLFNEDHQRLFQHTKKCGQMLGINLDFVPTGGCCDGNNLAAAGLPNLDTLGVVGGGIHTSEEYVKLSSLTERAKLSAMLLMRLASGQLPWGKNTSLDSD